MRRKPVEGKFLLLSDVGSSENADARCFACFADSREKVDAEVEKDIDVYEEIGLVLHKRRASRNSGGTHVGDVKDCEAAGTVLRSDTPKPPGSWIA